jgi:hypothetical protein
LEGFLVVQLRSIGAALSISVVSLICGVAPAVQAIAATFSDAGTFNTSQWSETILGGGDVVDTRMATGGNPGELIQLQTIPMGGSIVIGVYLNSDATWDPSTLGEIATIDMGLDVRLIASMFNHPDGQAYGIAVGQDGEIYRSGFPVTGQDLTWSSRSILGVSAAGFTGLNADGYSNLALVSISPRPVRPSRLVSWLPTVAVQRSAAQRPVMTIGA